MKDNKKKKNQQYGHKRYKHFSGDGKQKFVGYRKKYYRIFFIRKSIESFLFLSMQSYFLKKFFRISVS